MSKMHYFCNKFLKIAKRLLTFDFGRLNLSDFPNCSFSNWLWRNRTWKKQLWRHFQWRYRYYVSENVTRFFHFAPHPHTHTSNNDVISFHFVIDLRYLQFIRAP